MIGTPIAFGLTMVVCFTLFYYYWRIRQLRARLLSVQATAPAHDVGFPVGIGIGKNVVETFPTIDACELKSTASEDLQCPICLVEYEQWEVLRQLPFCGHIFHTLCVGAWFEKQTTCPVCRTSMSELTESFSSVEDNVYRGPRTSDAALVEAVNESPPWIRINRHLPLPAPPTVPTPESTTRACTCSGTTTATLAKPSSCDPRRGTSTEFLPTSENSQSTTRACTCSGAATTATLAKPLSTDFHVVNVQQCKCTAKPVTSDVQILIFQASVLASDPVRLDVERFLSAGVTCNNNKPLETPQLIRSPEKLGQTFVSPKVQLSAGSTSSRCDSSANPNFGEAALDLEEASFELQHVVTETGD